LEPSTFIYKANFGGTKTNGRGVDR